MQWVWERFSFRGGALEVAHFEAPCGGDVEVVPDELTLELSRCEDELGACLWHDTNIATLAFLEKLHGCYQGLKVLELGAGAGVCGIALAVDGADATVTDLPSLVPLLHLNVEHNGFSRAGCASGAAARGQVRPRKQGRRKVGKRGGGAKGGDADSWGDGDEGLLGAGHAVDDAGDAGADGAEKRVSGREKREMRAAAKQAKTAKGFADARPGETEPMGRPGNCQALAVDWLDEARSPALAPGAFDLVVVCDCLYGNKASWEALRSVLLHTLTEGGQVVLSSALLRVPFLDEFATVGLADSFTVETRDVSESSHVVVLRRTG